MIRYIQRLGCALAVAVLSASVANAQVTVGGKNFTEQLLMAEMTTMLLEDRGFDVSKRDGMGSTVLRKAQVNGQVDVYWEYTGTSLITYNKMSPEGLTPEETVAKVREADKEKGLVWLECSNANNTYALAVREGDDKTGGIESFSDLAAAYRDGRGLKLAAGPEFAHREDGLPGVEETYDFDVSRGNLKMMELGLTYSALKEGQVDVGVVFATDGRIAAFDFRTLEDDKGFFPNYALCPVVRQDTLDKHPDVRQPLEKLASMLDDETMRSLNKRVDVDKMEVGKVAEKFLEEQGLI